ncbi:hypothetical protein A9G38_00015 [Gilliamella sp. Imp1-1]|nr:hypothetical protein A9G38_00015 [Gilliamella apicola]
MFNSFPSIITFISFGVGLSIIRSTELDEVVSEPKQPTNVMLQTSNKEYFIFFIALIFFVKFLKETIFYHEFDKTTILAITSIIELKKYGVDVLINQTSFYFR